MKRFNLELTRAIVAASICLWAEAGFAAEVAEGTVISKDNVDKLKGETFEGKTIGSMITEKVEWQIKNWNLKLKLGHSKPLELDPKFIAATKKFSPEVKFDPATREVTGWKAGIPFPEVSDTDPNAGDKLIWNYYYASPEGSTINNQVSYLYITADKGIDKVLDINFLRYFYKGRLDKGEAVEGDGKSLSNTLIFFKYPYDVRGLSTFTIRYDTPQLEDNWVYVKSARRTRRLSGSSWMDPIGGSDQLNDDIYVWNARPSWYPKIRLLGKRWVLAATQAKAIKDESKKGTPDEFPTVDLKAPPYWNPVETWQPREVYIIEGTAPAEHPYGKKVVYMDVAYPRIYFGEIYDKKNEFWKFVLFNTAPTKGETGIKYLSSIQGHTIDFKARHATIFINHAFRLDEPGIKPADISMSRLEAESR